MFENGDEEVHSQQDHKDFALEEVANDERSWLACISDNVFLQLLKLEEINKNVKLDDGDKQEWNVADKIIVEFEVVDPSVAGQ